MTAAFTHVIRFEHRLRGKERHRRVSYSCPSLPPPLNDNNSLGNISQRKETEYTIMMTFREMNGTINAASPK
jgi:hypothetical protein